MTRDAFYEKLNELLNECGWDMPSGSKRRPFLAYSWKKYSSKKNMDLTDISRFNDIREVFIEHNKWGFYLGLMYHRID